MAAGPVLLCALLRLAEGQVTTYDVGALAEVRGIMRLQHAGKTELAEGEVAPRLGLAFETRTLRLSAAYAPRLWVSTMTDQVQALQRGAFQATFKPDPLYRLTASANGASGYTNLLAPAVASPAGTAPAPIQTVGAQTHVHYLYGELGAGLDATPTRRARLVLNAAYLVDGGADAAARLTFPLQRGPRASLVIEWQASDDDRFDTSVLSTYRTFTTSALDRVTGLPIDMPWVSINTVTETWRRKFGTELSTWLGLGGALTGVEGVGGASDHFKLIPPIVDLGVQHVTEGGFQRLRLAGRYGPIVDAVTGRIYQRADSTLFAAWSLSRTWQVVVELAAGVAIGGVEDGLGLVTGEARMVHGLTRELNLAWGVRGLYQSPPAHSTLVTYQQWGLFVTLTYLHRGAI